LLEPSSCPIREVAGERDQVNGQLARVASSVTSGILLSCTEQGEKLTAPSAERGLWRPFLLVGRGMEVR